ncbi:IstA1: transposase for insertion sequence element IS21 [Desulfosarcina variabilis str. Montpellier]|uniref:IS21 family transposase n=1 Tax=Desulfosarcina variabilis TaxID=2300 RepID=UPI003AFAE6A4
MVVFVRNRQDLEHRIILMHAEGWGIRALSRHFDMGRNTIRRILRKHQEQRDKGHDVLEPRRPVARKSKLDAFKPMIKALLERYPDMTGVRVYEELRENNFDGGQSIVRDYLRKIRPRPKKEPVVRFETLPGRQGQMDWSPYTFNFTRSGRQKVLCFSYILGFSRRHYIDFTTDRRFHTLIRRHQDAFARFKGVPATCLYDGEKTVILRWEGGQPVYNPAFVAFITHYHCRPVACLPGRAQTKGKIEAPFQYIEKNLLNGRTFADLSDLRQTAAWWLKNRSDVHVHDTTGRRPLELFLEQEQAALKPLPAHPYDTAEVALRVCRVDGFLEHETNFYSVPYEYIADILTVKATEREIIVYSPDLRVIAHHERKPMGASEKVEEPDHRKSEKVRYGLEPVKAAFLSLGDGAQAFLDGLKERHRHYCGFQARYILRLKEHYHCEDIHAALVHAAKYYAFDGKAVQRILKARHTPRQLEQMSTRSVSQCAALLPDIKQRPLEAYSSLLKESVDEHDG